MARDENPALKYCPLCGKEYAEGDVCAADGAVLILTQPESDSLVGQVLKDSYHIKEKIGAGGMGAVYRAVQMPLGRDVAVKTLLPSLQSTPSMIQRFFQEAKVLSQLSHPNVVSIIDFGNTESGMIFMVMEYLRGSSLSELVPKGRGLPMAETVTLMTQICAGVAAAHRSQLVHRDLKPENIFVTEDDDHSGQVKVLDFGIARTLEGQQQTRLTQTGLLMGTPGFLAPEQIESTAEADTRSDVYALGAILYFLLTGQRPYQGGTPQSIMVQQLRQPPSLDLELLGEPLAAVVFQAMYIDPQQRYQTPGDLMAALTEVIDPNAATVRLKAPTVDEASKTISLASTAPLTRPQPEEIPPTRPLSVRGAAPSASAPVAGGWRSKMRPALAALLLAVALLALWWWRSGDVGPSAGTSSEARGVTAEQVTVGMSAAFSGASRELGRGMQLGIETSFNEINDQGGIHGRKLRLVALDDGYEPSRTVANMAELLLQRGVFAILGNVGTPTAEVALPLVLEQKAPFFGAFTGADLLRKDPPDHYVFNLRAGYSQETAALVGHFLGGLGLQPSEIAVFAQEDSFGDAGYRGVGQTLQQQGYSETVPRLSYRRNTMAVEDAVERLLTKHPEVRGVVVVATYRAAAEFIRQVKDRQGSDPQGSDPQGSDPQGSDPQGSDRQGNITFACLSFVGSRAFAEQLQEYGPQYPDGIIVSQVVPHFDSPLPAVVRYREMLQEHFPAEQPGFVSLEGYLASRIFAQGLEVAGPNPNAESFVEAVESLSNFDLGIGAAIRYGVNRHQGSNGVWGTVLDSTANYQILPLAAPPAIETAANSN